MHECDFHVQAKKYFSINACGVIGKAKSVIG